MNITFPAFAFKIKSVGGKKQIFDIIRKKYVALTPEEKVRQLLIRYLVEVKEFPKSLLAVEMNVKLNQMQKRCDIVAFDREAKPFLIVECKSPSVKLTQKVFEQIARYNLTMNVKYLLVSNGLQHFACRMDYENRSYRFVEELAAPG